MSQTPSRRFVPSRVEGLPAVDEVIVHPDRLELLSAGAWVTVRFLDIARWSWPGGWLRRPLLRLGWRPWFLPVGDRDWFHPPKDRFFRFYTDPPLTVYMPADELATGHADTYFRRVQDVMLAGGFNTFDLG